MSSRKLTKEEKALPLHQRATTEEIATAKAAFRQWDADYRAGRNVGDLPLPDWVVLPDDGPTLGLLSPEPLDPAEWKRFLKWASTDNQEELPLADLDDAI